MAITPRTMVPLRACLLAVVSLLTIGPIAAHSPAVRASRCISGPCIDSSAQYTYASPKEVGQQLNAHDLTADASLLVASDIIEGLLPPHPRQCPLAALLPHALDRWVDYALHCCHLHCIAGLTLCCTAAAHRVRLLFVVQGLHLRWRVAAHLLGLLACVLTGATDDAALALYQALNLDSNEGKSYGLLDNVTELADKGKSWKGQVTHKGKSWEDEYTHKGDQMSPLVSNPLFEACEPPCRSGAAMAEPVLCHQDRNPTVLARDDAGSINKMPLSSGAAAATPAARQRRGWDLPKKTFQDRTTQQSLPRCTVSTAQGWGIAAQQQVQLGASPLRLSLHWAGPDWAPPATAGLHPGNGKPTLHAQQPALGFGQAPCSVLGSLKASTTQLQANLAAANSHSSRKTQTNSRCSAAAVSGAAGAVRWTCWQSHHLISSLVQEQATMTEVVGRQQVPALPHGRAGAQGQQLRELARLTTAALTASSLPVATSKAPLDDTLARLCLTAEQLEQQCRIQRHKSARCLAFTGMRSMLARQGQPPHHSKHSHNL
ncbi:hypothetical protein COO60DRAFT_1629954, partial [Scenedesmus sp. NREL 46B-D3]